MTCTIVQLCFDLVKIRGDVGIGTSSPAGNLDIAGGSGTATLCLNGACATRIGGFGNLQVFSANGTFTVPAGVTRVKVTVVGGGGGGGNILYAGSNGGGGGGGAVKIVSGLTPGGTVSVTVGAGGSGGTGVAR